MEFDAPDLVILYDQVLPFCWTTRVMAILPTLGDMVTHWPFW